MSLQELLQAAHITSALVIDDGYDESPSAEDLAVEEEAWANLLDDLNAAADDRERIINAFPGYVDLTADKLRDSDEFVAALWGLRTTLSAGLLDGLFETFEADRAVDREYLQRLEAALDAVGLPATRAGRSGQIAAMPEIVFVDLFLNCPQNARSMDRAMERIRSIVVPRKADPPLVVLMSRSPLLAEKKVQFRDSVGLMGAMFRVRSKSDLLAGQTLARTLELLVRHRADALRLARFLDAWDQGLSGAKERFLATIRRLDLSDYGQVRELLLDAEGQPLGSYLLDVFDRVLEYEIEGHPETIQRAEELNGIDTGKYPSAHLPGSPDLQALVRRLTFENPERMRVTEAEVPTPVWFGDILGFRSALDEGLPQAIPPLRTPSNVFVVLTPPCDLVRANAEGVLLLGGVLTPLTPSGWSCGDGPPRTSMVSLPAGGHGQIEWSLTDVRSKRPAELKRMLGPEGAYQRLGRLRETQTLSLQQRLFAKLGRVGLPAQMPATFHVGIEAYVFGLDGALTRLANVGTLDRDGGVYYAGRIKKDPAYRLVLAEAAKDELLSALEGLAVDSVHAQARQALARLKTATSSFASALDGGLEAPKWVADKCLTICLPVPGQGGANAQLQPVGVICAAFTGQASAIKGQSMALVLALTGPAP